MTEILEKGADKSGVKAAVGASALAAGMGKTRYADNKAEQAEMAKRVKNNEAEEKSVAKKAEPKAEKKVEEKKAAPKKAAKAEGGDDLKELSGVGPALEKKLQEAGVTTFAQIAAWTADDIAEMDEKLSFKGRIEREGWVAQAKELVKG